MTDPHARNLTAEKFAALFADPRDAYDFIPTGKREHMIACAEHYTAEHEIVHWQIDVISIERKPGMEPVITYFENAI